MNRQPPFPSNSFPPGAGHPVPPLVSEICKLAYVGEGARLAQLECIAQARRMPSLRWVPGDPVPTTGLAVHLSLTPGVMAKLIPTRCPDRLRAPDFEVISPAVVIRRRPQRD